MSDAARPSPRFVVSINGEQRCVAGFDGAGGQNVLLIQRRGFAPTRSADLFEGFASLRVSGLRNGQRVRWLKEQLHVDDEISVQIAQNIPADRAETIEVLSGRPSQTSIDQSVEELSRLRQRIRQPEFEPVRRVSISINETQMANVGVENGILTIQLQYHVRDATEEDPAIELGDQDTNQKILLHAFGGNTDQSLSWLNELLYIGDQIGFRLLGEGQIDPPQHRRSHRIPPGDQIITRTKRLTLCRLIEDDLDFLTDMLGDPEVMQYWPAPKDRQGAEEWLRRQQQRYEQDGCGYWQIVDNKTHQPVGQAGVVMTEIEGEADRLPCLGWMVHRPYQRQGYGIEAAWACCQYVYNTLNRPTVYTIIRPENEPSMALARKLGLQAVRLVQYKGMEHVLMKRDQRSTRW